MQSFDASVIQCGGEGAGLVLGRNWRRTGRMPPLVAGEDPKSSRIDGAIFSNDIIPPTSSLVGCRRRHVPRRRNTTENRDDRPPRNAGNFVADAVRFALGRCGESAERWIACLVCYCFWALSDGEGRHSSLPATGASSHLARNGEEFTA